MNVGGARSVCTHCGQPLRQTYDLLPLAEARPHVLRLVKEHGSIRRAGHVYAERHGITLGAGERLFQRILHGPGYRVSDITLDRLSVTT